MEKIGFIGVYDKTDFIMYLAKILTVLGKRVLVVDSTLNQKAKYVVPALDQITAYYVTQYEDFDVAIGFHDFDHIADYLEVDKIDNLYDIALIDVDSNKVFNNYEMQNAQKNYFVTSFDLFSLKKGLEVLSGINEKIKIKKVLFSRKGSKEENEYLNFLSSNYKIVWDNDIVYFPIERGDMSAIMENQRVSKIKIRNLTEEYIMGLSLLAQDIYEVNMNELKKAYKLIDKG